MRTVLFLLVTSIFLSFKITKASQKGYYHTGVESNFIREEVRTWEAPNSLRSNYPYYLSGYDDEDRPIWVAELGKWDIRKIALNGNKTIPDFIKYVDKVVYHVLHSLDLNTTDPTAATQAVGIIDLDNFSYSQLTSIPTAQLIVKLFTYLSPVMLKVVHHGYVVNTNFYGMKILDLLRPSLGPVMERVDIYGTDKSKWLPRLLKNLPRDQLPEWYGGDADFVPVKVYG